MVKEKYTDPMLVNAIRTGGTVRDRALKYLFDHAPYRGIIDEVVARGGGTGQYTDSVYEDCLVQLDRLIRRFEYKEDSFSHFFEKAAKKIWCHKLQENETIRNHVLQDLTKDQELQRQVFATITKNSGTREDAEDCYQNGLILLNTQLQEGKFRGGAIKGFFHQVCYNLWRNELKKHKATPLSNEKSVPNTSIEDPLRVLETKEQSELLDKIFQQLGDSCQKILQLKYFVVDQFTMDEIAQRMGLKNAQNASNALSKCRKMLWELLHEHNHAYKWNKNTNIE